MWPSIKRWRDWAVNDFWPRFRLGPQSQVALLILEVPLKRHHGRGGRHRAEPLADYELALDECDEQVAALAQYRTGGLGDLFQAGQRPSARRTAAARASHRSMGWPGDENKWSYQPGERMPAP